MEGNEQKNIGWERSKVGKTDKVDSKQERSVEGKREPGIHNNIYKEVRESATLPKMNV